MVKRYDQGDATPALTRLAGQVDALATDVKALASMRVDVDAHSRGLADLTQVLRELTERVNVLANGRTLSAAGEGEAAFLGDDISADAASPAQASGGLGDPAPNWITVTDVALAVRWLDDLSRWVSRVWTRYGPLPECWPWHAHVVAELLVCRHQWLDATADGVGADLLAAWHDRWRPGVHHRVTKYLAACERTDGLHVGLRSTRWTYDTAFLEPLAQWWATTHGRDPRTPPPGLTQDHSR